MSLVVVSCFRNWNLAAACSRHLLRHVFVRTLAAVFGQRFGGSVWLFSISVYTGMRNSNMPTSALQRPLEREADPIGPGKYAHSWA